MIRLRDFPIALAVFGIIAVPADAHDYSAGSLKVLHPWARATPRGVSVGGGYLTIANSGATPDRLLDGSTEIAARIEIHESSQADGVARMKPLERGLAVSPGQTVELKPGGVHLMLVGLKRPLQEGERFAAVLRFDKAGPVNVEFQVTGIGAKAPASEHQGH